MQHFYSITPNELASWLKRRDIKLLHAPELLKYVYKKGHTSVYPRQGFPQKLAEDLASTFSFVPLKIKTLQQSAYDGSIKFLFELKDGEYIESVLMPEKGRLTLCLSSQVGCAQACVFCQTGRMGLRRNLCTEEIVGQVQACNQWLIVNPNWLLENRLPLFQRISNLVFMGMGEPLDNVENVSRSIEIFKDPYCFSIAPRKITVSTAGHLDGLKEISFRQPKVAIALSLHVTDPQKRSKLMPINKRFPIEDVLNFLRTLCHKEKKTLMIQYTLIKGQNDSPANALALLELLRDIPCKVNLIPMNPIASSPLLGPTPENLKIFQGILSKNGITCMVRFSKGQDISGGCGQLVIARPAATQNT